MPSIEEVLAPEHLARVRAGDERAFEAFFRVWYPRLADYAFRMLESRDAAEDVVQNLFVALWNRRDRWPEGGKMAGYLHRAVRNRSLNQLRSRKTARRWLERVDPDPVVAPVAETVLEHEELTALLRTALDNLSPRCREVFVLSRDQGLTYPAIADTLGISVKTVETLMGRALKALRAQLGPRLSRDPG